MILSIFDDFATWLTENAKSMVLTVVAILVALGLILFLSFIVQRVKKNHNKRVYTVVRLIESIAKYVIFIVLIFLILGIWGVNVTAAVACIAVIGLVFGLAALDLIKDLIAGIAIVIDNQFDVDEVVEIVTKSKVYHPKNILIL